VLLVATVGVFMSFLDVTLGNIALPDIRASFAGDSLAGLLDPRPLRDRFAAARPARSGC
jgi:hypothetical protein